MNRTPIAILISISMTAFLSQTAAQALSPFPVKNIFATSPEAAMLGRFGDVPISYYTGTADVTVPLYSIKEGGLTIPIALHYHNSGIKVEDEATNVGLGWYLEAGGAIIQAINGKEDPLDNLQAWDPTAYSAAKSTSVAGVFQQISANEWACAAGLTPGYSTALFSGLKTGHGQPDIFQYRFPGGYSGKFFINPDNGQIVLLDKKEDIKFERNSSGWKATTLDGHVFYFYVIETAWYGDYTSKTFMLSKIQFNSGKEMLFNYYTGSYTSHHYEEKVHRGFLYSLDGTGEVGTSTVSSPSHTTKTLTSISMDDLLIEFNLEDREDLFSSLDGDGDNTNGTLSAKRIKSINIKYANQLTKSWSFVYDYFPFTTTGSSAYFYTPGTTPQSTIDMLGKRLRLLSVSEIGYTATGLSIQHPSYEFSYDATVMPLKSSFARDFWGYYNGKNNAKLIPDLSFFYFSGYPEYSSMPASLLSIQGGNRTTNTSLLKAGMLTKIKYPAGGFTSFEYEPNEFSNISYPDQNIIATAERPVNIKDQNNTFDTYSSQFVLNQTQTIRFTISMEKGPPANTVTFNDILPSTVTLTKVLNIGTSSVSYTTLKTWQMVNNIDYQNDFNADGVYQWVEDITFPYQSNATYFVTCNLANGIPPQNTSTAQAAAHAQFKYYDIPSAGLGVSKGGGVRVLSVANYSASGALATKKQLNYIKEDLSSSGALLSTLKILYSAQNYFLSASPPTGGGTCPPYTAGQSTVWYLSSESYTPFENAAAGNPIGYSRVEETEVDGSGISNGKHIYHYFNIEKPSYIQVPEDPDLRNGLISKEEIKNSANTLLKEINYVYQDLGATHFNGMKLIPTFFGYRPCDYLAIYGGLPGTSCTPWEYASSFKEYSAAFYPLNGNWYKLKSKEVKTYDGATPYIVKEDYTYDVKGLLTKTEMYDSKSLKVTNETDYPTDVAPGLSTPEEIMSYTNRYNTVLERRRLVNNNQVSRQKYNYAVVPGQSRFVPLSVQHSVNGGALTTDVQYLSVGSFERIQQYVDKLNISIIWSDFGSDPLARISNLSNNVLDHAAFTSFERNQTLTKGGWTYSGASVTELNAPTGAKAYSLSNGAITKPGLNASYTYVISYFTKGSVLSIPGTISGYPVLVGGVNGWKLYEHRITGQTQATISGNEIIDELRLYTLGAQMTSFTVQTGIGVTSETSPEGRVTFYEYDAFGRLWLIRNNDKQITKKICYNYFGQPESCEADANPIWAPNGKIGCDVCPNSPTNTINVQVHQEVDVNPNSPTYGATRWVSDGIPGKCKSTCP